MKILIIKLGALGDVVRTLPILMAVKEKYPDSEITWITRKNAAEIVKNSSYINKVFTPSDKITGKFDILYNFDIDEDATELAKNTDADKKYGFSSEEGYPIALNFPAEYYLNTLFDDELKKSNKKTYQKMMFDAAELQYDKQNYSPELTEDNKKYASEFLEKSGLNKERKKIIGIHLGASSRWPSKRWHKDNLIAFVERATKKNYKILLFGGVNEKQEHKRLFNELNKKYTTIYKNDPENSIMEFASLVNTCDLMVCSDSLALHIALALKKPTICLFFVTSPDEVEDYGLLKKIVSSRLKDFFPEKMDEYSEELTKSISADEVLNGIEDLNIKSNLRAVNAIIKHPFEDKFLTIKRKNEEIHSGRWGFPGGIVETSESIEAALKREVNEEVGLETDKIISKISDYDYERPDKTRTFGESYLVNVRKGDVKLNEEIEDFKWVTVEEFMELDYIEGLDGEILSVLEFLNENKNK